MFEKVKQYILDNLIKSNGHITIQRMNEEYIRRTATPEVADALLSTEGTCLRDQILYYTKGKLHCVRCGKHILPYPKFLGADKFYCSKECAYPAQKPKTCCVCQKEFYSSNPKQVTCSRKCGVVYRESRHMEKYGCKSPQQRPEIVKKTKQTLIDKYGADCTMNIPGVKEKSKQTMLKKYGVDHNMKSKDFIKQHKSIFDAGREKAKETMLQKYGVECPLQHGELRDKRNKTLYESLPEHYKEMKTKNWWDINYEPYVTSLREISSKTGVSVSTLSTWAKSVGVDIVAPMRSSSEKHISDFLNMHGIDHICNIRNLITPYEIDIYIPSLKTAIEVNGSYWHSDEFLSPSYHKQKSELCKSVGVNLIHIFDWDNIDLILNSLLPKEKINARQCEVRKIDGKLADQFCDAYHRQGKRPATENFGLYHNGELVMVMTFGKPRFNKNYDWENIRLCTKTGVSVRGGAGKLMAFARAIIGGSIITYSPIDKGYNTVYEKIGFKKIGETSPNYYWVDRQGVIYLSRYQCQKHKLEKLLGKNYNPELSEAGNMIANGFFKVHDCGQEVFVLE